MIGDTIHVTVDRPFGSVHPQHQEIIYPLNYGYIEGLMAPDGEEQDVYILGVDVPLKSFTGKVIAIIHRLNDVEDKWVAAPESLSFTKDEIIEATYFQEQFFEIQIFM